MQLESEERTLRASLLTRQLRTDTFALRLFQCVRRPTATTANATMSAAATAAMAPTRPSSATSLANAVRPSGPSRPLCDNGVSLHPVTPHLSEPQPCCVVYTCKPCRRQSLILDPDPSLRPCLHINTIWPCRISCPYIRYTACSRRCEACTASLLACCRLWPASSLTLALIVTALGPIVLHGHIRMA